MKISLCIFEEILRRNLAKMGFSNTNNLGIDNVRSRALLKFSQKIQLRFSNVSIFNSLIRGFADLLASVALFRKKKTLCGAPYENFRTTASAMLSEVLIRLTVKYLPS